MAPAADFDRVVLIVLDSVGIGALPDADKYGDAGSATLPHIAEAVGGLNLPNMQKLGLGGIANIKGVEPADSPLGLFGKIAEKSVGKDTTTGHWEMMGLIVSEPFPVYPEGFPDEIVGPFIQATGRGVLGNLAASGTQIIEQLGAEHLKTGKWILYTSADSVFQLAAHEGKVPLDELYDACKKARKMLDPFRIGRVIARPFIGEVGSFKRTYNRHDFSMLPDGPTVLNALQQASVEVIGVGKINDIYAGQGVDRSVATSGNADGMKETARLLDEVKKGFIFINLVDFDMVYGHRRNPEGYAKALEAFDLALGPILEQTGEKDLVMITADHGCDPTFTAHTDHTREYIPLLIWSASFASGQDLGIRKTFADLGATLAAALGVEWDGPGLSCLPG